MNTRPMASSSTAVVATLALRNMSMVTVASEPGPASRGIASGQHEPTSNTEGGHANPERLQKNTAQEGEHCED